MRRNCLITLSEAPVKGEKCKSQDIVFAHVIHIMFH
jgi:hypothetical protein